MAIKTVEPSAEQMHVFGERADTVGPVTMLNLLRYRDSADYSNYPHEAPCSGREAYRRYIAGVIPCVESLGGCVVFSGPALATVIGPDEEQWDDMLLVEYPSPQSLIDMRASERFQAIEHHRSAALDDSRLIAIMNGPMQYESST